MVGQLEFIEELLDICRSAEADGREERIEAALRQYVRRLERHVSPRTSRVDRLAELRANLRELEAEIAEDLAASGVPGALTRSVIGHVQDLLRDEIVSRL